MPSKGSLTNSKQSLVLVAQTRSNAYHTQAIRDGANKTFHTVFGVVYQISRITFKTGQGVLQLPRSISAVTIVA